MKPLFIILIFALLILSSCGDSTKTANLPNSTGNSGDIFLIMDSTQWKGPLGNLIDSVFSAEMQGLPREEPIFKLRWIDPRKLNFVLKQRRNLIFAVTLDQKSRGAAQIKKLFTEESIKQIKTNPELFTQTAQNVFAKNQEVLYLFGQTESKLIEQVKNNSHKLVEFFNMKERERLTKTLYKSGQLKGIPDIIKRDFNSEWKIPFGYQLVMNNQEFLWVRQINPKDDKDIIIAQKSYLSQQQFLKDSLIAWRNSICKKYLFADPDRPETFLLTETEVPYKPVITKEINFNKKFAVEMRGLWRTNNFVMGGPFLSYAIADESTNTLYYLEGFTYSPGKDQREIMRELETILYAFKSGIQIQPPAKN